jgi:Fe-S cluster assembly protein SufB
MCSVINFSDLKKQDLDHADDQGYAKKFDTGLSENLVKSISKSKNEPSWMLNIRLQALEKFNELPLPSWGPDLKKLDFEKIRYFALASDKKNSKTWDDVDPEIKRTFDRLKIPQAEREILAGVGAQYESENIYHNVKDVWSKKGVIFEDFDTAVVKYPELVKKYFSKCVPLTDHKFAALHYAVTSGGTFLYVPKGVEINQPLQAYFRMNAMNQGQFEHTLIIMEEEAKVHYIEGCSAPHYGSESLHAGCVEIFVNKGAQVRYSSVENWSKDTYNLNTKRAIIQDNGKMEWIGGNLGSGVTMLYPSSLLVGDNARADHLGIALANEGQNQDIGSKVTISGKNCRTNIVSKSLSKGGGISTYRGIVDVKKSAENAVVHVECNALLFDNRSIADTIPQINCANDTAQITHEASAGKISDEVLLYFQSRGIDEEEARGMIVNGFLNEVVKTLPLEYASELNRLIEMEMENSIG